MKNRCNPYDFLLSDAASAIGKGPHLKSRLSAESVTSIFLIFNSSLTNSR